MVYFKLSFKKSENFDIFENDDQLFLINQFYAVKHYRNEIFVDLNSLAVVGGTDGRRG